MASHDADMHTFCQWWKRSVRNGKAYAAGVALHGRSEERHWVRQYRSNWGWGLLYPLSLTALAVVYWPVAAIGVMAYPALALKVALSQRRRGRPWRESVLWGAFIVIGKVPNMLGQWRYLRSRPAAAGGKRCAA